MRFLWVGVVFVFYSVVVQAQIISAAVPDIVLVTDSPAGTPIEVAYNPSLNLYYSVSGGSPGVPVWTHDGTTGLTLLRTAPSNHDWRGLWWNDNLGQLEGNPCSSCQQQAIWVPDLDAGGYALGTGTALNPSNQPDFQSQGDYNEAADQFVYYHNGQIYRTDRVTNTSLAPLPITGLPVATTSLNRYFIGYTGMPGAEYVVWDYVNERALFIDSNGVYQGESVVSGGPDSRDNWEVGYANGRIFLWNGSGWNGYQIHGIEVGPEEFVPVPAMPMWMLGMLALMLSGLVSVCRNAK